MHYVRIYIYMYHMTRNSVFLLGECRVKSGDDMCVYIYIHM